MRKKFQKFISDTNSHIRTALESPPLMMVTDHAKIVDRIKVQSPGCSSYTFPLEEQFYGKKAEAAFRHPERYLYFLENIWVTGSEGHIFFDPRTVFAACPSIQEVLPKHIRRPLRFLESETEDPVFILRGRAPGNRAHFLLEHLPRLISCLGILRKNGDIKILVTPGHRDWQLQYLEKFGFPATKVMEGSETTMYCKRALFVPLLSEGGREVVCEKRYYDEIRRRFLFKGPMDGHAPPVFVGRRDAATRRLINEDEIFALASEFFPGLQMITLKGKTLDQQIALFQRAPVIIGPHGQPFRNGVFSSNSLIIQLVPGKNENANEYQKWGKNFNCISRIAGNECISLYSGIPLATGASHWHYNPNKLKEEIQKILALRQGIGT